MVMQRRPFISHLVLIFLATASITGHAYLLIDDQIDLSGVESSPGGVAIIYPRAIGPEVPDEATTTVSSITITIGNATDASATAASDNSTSTSAVTTPTTTTATEQSPAAEAAGDLADSASSPTSVYVAPAAPAARSAAPESAPVSRVWREYFENRGLEPWGSRVDRQSEPEAVETSQSPVFTARTPTSQPPPAAAQRPFVRKPVFAPVSPVTEPEAVTVGEYPSSSNQRNIYYPDINRIGVPTHPLSASASASAAASASASSSSSSFHYQQPSPPPAPAPAPAQHQSIKGGPAPYQWQNTVVAPPPSKTIRRVVMKSATKNHFQERENSAFTQQQQQQPVRVRVVTKTPGNDFQSNYLERLSQASAAASASASSATATSRKFPPSPPQQRFNQIQQQDSKDYEVINKVTTTTTTTGVKSPPPPPPAPLPPPPPPAPRPAPYAATKSKVRTAPVFEQQTEQTFEHENPEPEPYSFNFNVNDDSGNGQFRREEGDKNGVVRGSYGYTDAWGLYRIVDYVADANGFRATIRTNEPGLVERNPVTNAVDQPAQIQINAEETPAKVVELMRLKKPQPSNYI